jgi:serine/threonine-protein kinase
VGVTIASGELLKNRYRLDRTLGRGGMALVWLGHDEVLDRPVAVKVLSDTLASDPGFVVRFRREARTAAGLSHPNLVDVYDFSEEDERPYLVMQFVPGDDLAARIGRGERFDCDQLARELLDALSHIHAVGILHRDVKPANVIVEPEGTAKLIDFGIALPADATSLTRTGLVLGTERYTAPEVMEGRPATERSDLYSCGIVLRACAGERSRALEVLIAAMVAADPRERPLSAEHALDQLEGSRVLDEQPTQVFELPVAAPTEPLSWSEPGRGRRWIAVALLGLFAALAVVAALALSGGGDSPEDGGQQAAQAKEGKGKSAAAPAATEEPATQPEESEAEVASSPQASETDPARGVALNDEGFVLIEAGEPEAAVPVLEAAVSSFPEGTADLNYAYALYNLGNALRLSGQPEAAIPVLERRLEIPDQESAVLEELEAARAEAGTD